MKCTSTLLLLTGTLTASGQWLTDSLIAHFPMDGTPDDVIGGLVPVVTSGAPAFCTDRHGAANGAACFNGSSFWSYGDTLDMDTADFSIAYWVRLDTVLPPFYVDGINGQYLSDASLLVGKGTTVYGSPQRAGYSVMARNTNGVHSLSALWGGQINDVVYDETPIILHDWFHVVQSRCGSQQTLHVNGQLMFDISTSANRDLSVDIVFALGALDRDPTAHPDQGWLHGALDDVRIYKGRCLSQDEIDVLADHTQQWLHIPDGVVQNGISLGDIDVTGDQLTLEALVSWRPDQTSNIVSKHFATSDVNYLFRVWSFELSTTQGYAALSNPYPLCLDSVYHIAATYDGTSMKYYVNGSVTASQPWSGTLITNNLSTCIANMQTTMSEQMRGYIDEVRIWQVARSAAEIQANMYTLSDPANQPGLLGYYTFEGDYVNMADPGTWDGVPIGTQIGLAPNPGFTGQVSSANCLSTGLTAMEPISPVRMSPNPAQGTLLIDLNASTGLNGPITVLNALGQLIPLSAATVGVPENGERALTLDVSGLPKGAYFVVVPTEEGRLHGRFVKE